MYGSLALQFWRVWPTLKNRLSLHVLSNINSVEPIPNKEANSYCISCILTFTSPQKPAACLCPVPDEYSHCPPIKFLEDQFQYYPTVNAWVLQVVSLSS
jgi:hypothetical protein